MVKKTDKLKNFEKDFEELERLVDSLDNPGLTLQESLDIFEKAVKLSSTCESALEYARQRAQALAEVRGEDATQAEDTKTAYEEGFRTLLESRKKRIDTRLAELLQTSTPEFSGLYEAMNYSLNAGGKRIRPVLFLAVLEAAGKDPDSFFDLACALECVHSYSLIHDDLPAMDNDDFRRGKPTNHKVYGDGTAVLAGDGLLTYAFELMAAQSVAPAHKILQAIRIFAHAAGPAGMVGGQYFDLPSEGGVPTRAAMELMHRSKTGVIFTAIVQMAALLADVSDETMKALTMYGDQLGLAFQITDDILDVVGSEKEMGKPVGSDEKNHKTTYVSLLGVEGAREEAKQTTARALAALQEFDENAEFLRQLVIYLEQRVQ